MKYIHFLFLAVFLVSCSGNNKSNDENKEPIYKRPENHKDTLNADVRYPLETHFKSVRQLTFGGNNAEAYFSFNTNHSLITFQSDYSKWTVGCDQIFMIDPANWPPKGNKSAQPQRISTGLGRTTCSYFMPGDTEILYASTHLAGDACPPKPPHIKGRYIWPVYGSYDIFVADLHGKLKRRLTNNPGYDAEATVSPKGDKIVFTSTRSGDLELWTMDIDGKNPKQVTHQLGYDGGAFFSPDGKRLVFRASRPKTRKEIKDYKDLLRQGLVEPTNLEIFTCNIDGSDLKQVTHLGNANWAPFFHPSGKKIIFSSNQPKGGFHFNLWMINTDGTGLEQVSHDTIFDAFPMFSPDGKYLTFSSNRFNGGNYDTNLFIAEWKD